MLRHVRQALLLAILLLGLFSLAGGVASAQVHTPLKGKGGTWSLTGSTLYGRFGHTATLLSNGKVLVTGGYSKTGKWTRTGSMQVPRDAATATLLPSGKVLVAGGFDFDTQRYLASAEIYDPASGSWSPAANMNVARAVGTATLLPNGQVLVAGGVDTMR